MNKEDCYRILEIYKNAKFDITDDDLRRQMRDRAKLALDTLNKIDNEETCFVID